jgi:hypothetical protein
MFSIAYKPDELKDKNKPQNPAACFMVAFI